MATNNPGSPNNNKRKRGHNDSEMQRSMKGSATNGDSSADAMYASLLQGITDTPPVGVPQDETSRTAQAALQQQQSNYPEPNVFDHAAAHGGFEDPHMQQNVPQHQMQPGGQGIFDTRNPSQQGKPAVGTTAWHQLRKDNHKEGKQRSLIPSRDLC